MSRQDPHDRFAELAAGQALYSLEPADEQFFRAHLSGCAQCAQELQAHHATLADLAYAVDDVAPPSSLFEGIRAEVMSSGRPASWSQEPVPTAPVPPEPTGVVLRWGPGRRALSGRALVAAAAAAVLVLAMGGWNLALRDDRAQQVAANSRVAAAVHELGTPGSRPVPLRDRGGEVLAVALLQGSELTLLVDGLPANPEDSRYVLWARIGVEVRPVGAFDTGGSGLDVRDDLRVPGDVDRLSDLMVTLEPGRRAPSSPSSPVLAAGRA